MRFLFIFLFLFLGAQATAQNTQSEISFKAVYGDKPLILNEPIITEQNDTLLISTLKFYISRIDLFDGNIHGLLLDTQPHLIDFSKPENKYYYNHDISSYKTISLVLGIDSAINTSGAYSGDLDPTKGMYWTWQSGYINFKLEGSASNSTARKNKITFHLGGYSFPNSALQSIVLPTESKNKIDIILDLKAAFEHINFAKENEVMTPSKQSVDLAELFSFYFSCQ